MTLRSAKELQMLTGDPSKTIYGQLPSSTKRFPGAFCARGFLYGAILIRRAIESLTSREGMRKPFVWETSKQADNKLRIEVISVPLSLKKTNKTDLRLTNRPTDMKQSFLDRFLTGYCIMIVWKGN